MTGLYNKYKVDDELVNSGKWFALEKNADDSIVKVKLARYGGNNKAFQREVRSFNEEHRKEIELGLLSEKKRKEGDLHIFCTTILLDWENVQDEFATPTDYSVDAAKKLMNDLPDLYNALVNMSLRMENFKQALLEADAKN